MWGFELLDVMIGMIFVYLLLSLFCSAMNEFIERFMKNRAKDLERGLRELLDDPNGSGLVKKLYEHGLIKGLFKGDYHPTGNKTNLPSYIPTRNFALALYDIAFAGGATMQPDAVATLKPSAPGTPNPLRAQAGVQDDNSVRQALTAIVDTAGNNADKVREGIAAWFDSSMDRVAGWYKRRTQLIILTLGLCIAVVMNVNSLSLANDLWVHRAQRDLLVSSAQGYSQTNATPESPDKFDLQSRIEAIRKYNLPLGWDNTAKENIRSFHWSFLLQSLVGWLLTAFAVSLGAPFWFDVLNKFIVVRSTVKPREKSAEEPSKN